jgi:PAS fold
MKGSAETPSDLGFLGFWAADFRTGAATTSSALRQLFQICGDGTSLAEYQTSVHPDDREWLMRERLRSVGPSGWGVVEYRIIDAAGQVRWLMCRAIYETDPEGNLICGRGMLFDVTDFKADGNSPRTAPAPLPNPLQSLVDASLEAFEAARQLGDSTIIATLGSALAAAGRLMGSSLSPGTEPRH